MKVKNYERTVVITIFTVLIIIIEIGLFFFFNKNRITEYINISTIVVDNNEVRVVVDDRERKILYNNSVLYVGDNKMSYSILLDNGILWQKNKTKYYEMVLKVKFKEKYKYNDIVTISLAKQKITMIEAIIKTWGGE